MSLSRKEARKLDDAARAGWLYYVAGKTQEEIAQSMNVSRQTAQRMVALSVSAGLIKVRLEHPIAKCMDLKQKLERIFGLKECIVVPSEEHNKNSIAGLAQAGASEMERYLKSETPKTLAVGTGRTLKACVEELGNLRSAQHKIVALLGNMANDGSASQFNVVEKMAEHLKATQYPVYLPVIPKSISEKDNLHSQSLVAQNLKMAENADVTFVGIGNVARHSPLHLDGFIDLSELQELLDLGAVGEVIGWVYNQKGQLLDCQLNKRIASAKLNATEERLIYGIAAGEDKIKAIFGALRSHMINCLITNEYSAQELISLSITR